jgi:ABC-type polysaccharide/polyol phosphate transport system ATPase subunit
MNNKILSIENVSKQYQLGQFGTGTIGRDVDRWWHKIRGKEDPYLKIGQTNDRTSKEKAEFVWALKDINFEVNSGEVLGIIGKNGAGKSTLLKLLSRVTSPTAGFIRSAGRMASLLEVGTGFHPELTGLENIYLNGAILGMTKAEIKRKLDEIIDFSGCALYIDTPVKRYSSGMTVRLGFAVAAFLEPEILVVDEVLAVGDAEFQKKAIGKMQDVSKGEGRTVLFVSHNMGSIKQLCTRAITLVNGQVGFDGNVSDAIDMYLSDGLAVSETGIIPLDMKRQYGTSQFKFTKVELLKAEGVQSKDFFFQEPIKVRVYFSVFSEMSNYNIMIKVGTHDGQRILLSELNSDALKNAGLPEKLMQGDYTAEIEINTPLLPGSYSMYLGAGAISGLTLDWVERVYDFYIHQGGINENYRWRESFGYVYEKSNWQINFIDK